MTATTRDEIDVIVRFCELHADATSSVGDALLMRKAADMLRTLRDQREADAKMLDWLDAQRNDLVDYHCGEPMLMGHSWGVDGKCETVRQAITEAMPAQGEKC